MGAVVDRAITKLRDLLTTGQLGPGERLPAEAELAAELKVSRNALREAVRALCEAGVLEIRRGDGTFVSNLSPETLLGGLGLAMDLIHDDALLEIFEVRRLLEPAVTGLAAMRATQEDIVELSRSLEMLNSAEDDDELIELDLAFHRTIVQITGNSTLCTLMDALAGRASRVRKWRGRLEHGTRTFTFEQHSRIVEAIIERNAILAAAASTVHVTASEAWLREALSPHHEPSPSESFRQARSSRLSAG